MTYKAKNYENLQKTIDKTSSAYLDDGLDPKSPEAKELVNNIAALYKAKNEADKIRNEATHDMESLKKDKVSRNLEVGLKIFGISAPILAQTGWIMMSYIAEDSGKILTTRTFRDFVSKALRLKI